MGEPAGRGQGPLARDHIAAEVAHDDAAALQPLAAVGHLLLAAACRAGRRVPEIAVEGDFDVEGALVLDGVSDDEQLRAAHQTGRPIVVRASSAEEA